MYVVPGARGRGVARRLLGALEQAAVGPGDTVVASFFGSKPVH
jgi:GNAT superfamily N-acetyltransferase